MASQPGNGNPKRQQQQVQQAQQESNSSTNKAKESQSHNQSRTEDIIDNKPSGPSGPSLISRIQESATGLAKNAFLTPGSSAGITAGEMAQGMLSNGGKGGRNASSASALRGPGADGLLSQPQPGGSGSGSVGSGGGFRSQGLRDRNADLGMEQEGEQEQFQSGTIPAQDELSPEFSGRAYDNLSITNSDLDILPAMESSENGKGKGKSAVRGPAGTGIDPDFTAAWERSKQHQRSTPSGPITLPTDGAAVVSLLSDPAFDPDLTLTTTTTTTTNHDTTISAGFDFDLDFEPQQEYEQPPPASLSVEEMKLLESFKRRDPHNIATYMSEGQEREGRTRRITPFSLIPDIEPFLLNNHHNQQDQHGQGHGHGAGDGVGDTDATTTSLKEQVLSSLPGAKDWIPVEEGYHDEVWGYLRPLLEAAKAELEINNQNRHEYQKGEGGEEEGPAVRRLKGILNQMRARLGLVST